MQNFNRLQCSDVGQVILTEGKREQVRRRVSRAPCWCPLRKEPHARREGPRCSSAGLYLAEQLGELVLAPLIVLGRPHRYRLSSMFSSCERNQNNVDNRKQKEVTLKTPPFAPHRSTKLTQTGLSMLKKKKCFSWVSVLKICCSHN